MAKEAGAATTAEGLGPGKLATFVLEGVLQEVGIQGYSFLSDLLFGSGDVTAEATAEKLDGIQSQLDRITTRLDTIDTDVNAIKGQIAGVVLSDKLEEMRGWNNKMTTLTRSTSCRSPPPPKTFPWRSRTSPTPRRLRAAPRPRARPPRRAVPRARPPACRRP